MLKIKEILNKGKNYIVSFGVILYNIIFKKNNNTTKARSIQKITIVSSEIINRLLYDYSFSPRNNKSQTLDILEPIPEKAEVSEVIEISESDNISDTYEIIPLD